MQILQITPADGVFTFSNVSIYEGTLVTFKYTVDSTDVDQKFTIPSANADTSTLKVTVQNSADDTTLTNYTLAGGYTDVESTIKSLFYTRRSETANMKFILVMVLTVIN